MRDDELDRIYSDETRIEPSPGFTARVMDAVRHEASAPPPIPFPWKCALPCLAAWTLLLVSVVIKGFGQAAPVPSTSTRFPPALTTLLRGLFEAARTVGAGWIMLALLLALASTMLSMRLTRGDAR
jgi:hypothetical protein